MGQTQAGPEAGGAELEGKPGRRDAGGRDAGGGEEFSEPIYREKREEMMGARSEG